MALNQFFFFLQSGQNRNHKFKSSWGLNKHSDCALDSGLDSSSCSSAGSVERVAGLDWAGVVNGMGQLLIAALAVGWALQGECLSPTLVLLKVQGPHSSLNSTLQLSHIGDSNGEGPRSALEELLPEPVQMFALNHGAHQKLRLKTGSDGWAGG